MSVFSIKPRDPRQPTPRERIGYAFGDTLLIANEIGRRVACGAGIAIETIWTAVQERSAAERAKEAHKLQIMHEFAALPVEAQDEYFDKQAKERSARIHDILGAPGRALRNLFDLTEVGTANSTVPLAVEPTHIVTSQLTRPIDPVA